MNPVNVLGFVAVLAVLAYGPWATSGVLNQDAVRNIPMGQTLPFSNLSSSAFQEICLLQPYQDRLVSSETSATRVNEFLATVDYIPDEGRFAFVLIGRETIEIAVFKRSRHLDILAKHTISPSVEETLPKGFVPLDCANGETAALMKTELRDRTYIVLGEVR